MTESFTWEELPTTHPDTGHDTKAGYIQKIPVIAIRVFRFLLIFHGIRNTVIIVYSRGMILPKWYPFDATVSPAYELANLSQVKLQINLTPFEKNKDIQTVEYSSQMYSKLWINNYFSEIL
jgi:hypothetical protein